MNTKTITESSLVRRINRALSHHGQILRKCRVDSRYYPEYGDYYCVDIQTRGINEKHVDIDDLARELQVIKDYELRYERKEDTVTATNDDTMTEKEFSAIARQMQRELRVMTRRISELTKKDKYGGLGTKEREELEKLFKDAAKKAAENVQKLLAMPGHIKSPRK
jgi:GTPase involved in cell partitioning and DNA repair